jgi:pre-mRNA-splicing factor RBM22/SLT11
VTFTEREAAEKAAENVANKLVVKGLRLKLMWGRPQQPRPERREGEAGPPSHGGLLPRSVQAPAAQPSLQPPLGASSQAGEVNYLNLPPPAPAPSTEASYPSMDPEGMGTAVKVPSREAPRQSGPHSQPQLQQRPPFQQPFHPPPNQGFRPPGSFPQQFQPAPFPYGGGQQGYGPPGPFPSQQGHFFGQPQFNGPPQGPGGFPQGAFVGPNGGGPRPLGGRGPPPMNQQRTQQ